MRKAKAVAFVIAFHVRFARILRNDEVIVQQSELDSFLLRLLIRSQRRIVNDEVVAWRADHVDPMATLARVTVFAFVVPTEIEYDDSVLTVDRAAHPGNVRPRADFELLVRVADAAPAFQLKTAELIAL